MAGENDDLMLEVTGSSNKAVSALAKVIVKVADLQSVFEKMSPSLKKFTTELAGIAESSKGIAALKNFTESTNRQSLSAKDAESKMAMYQARLDRATVSMDKSRVASEKLAAAQRKLRETTALDAANKSFLDNFQYKGFSNQASKFANTAAPDLGTPDIPTPPKGSARLATEILNERVSNEQPTPFKVNNSQALSALDQTRSYIDRISPSISQMGGKAYQEFSKISSELVRVSSQIDNQRALYSQLASAATKASNANGEGSSKYLQLEKRMLSADRAIDKLIAKQEKLKEQMSGISSTTDKASSSVKKLGDSASKTTSSGLSGLQKTLNMMEKMFIRIIAFRIFSAISKSITDGMNDIAQGSARANASLSAISTSTLYLKNSISAAFMPVIQALTPVITQLLNSLANLFNMIGMLNARIFGNATSVTVAKLANVDYAKTVEKAGDSASKAAKKAKDSLMSFDELNKLTEKTSSASNDNGMPSPSSMFTTEQIPSRIASFGDKIKTVLGEWKSYAQPTVDAFDRLKTSLQPLETFAAKGAEDFYNDFLKPIGKWTLGTALPSLFDTLGKLSKDVDWATINKSLKDLWKALEPFTEKIGDGLLWFLRNVLEPVAAWAMNNVVPEAIKSVKDTIKVLDDLINLDKPTLNWFYNDFLKPLGQWSGGVFVSSVKSVNDVLELLHDILSGDIPQAEKDAEKALGDYKTFLRNMLGIPELSGKTWQEKGSAIYYGVVNGLKNAMSFLTNPGAWLGQKIIEGYVGKFGANIPKTWGSDMVNGLKKGLGDIWNSIRSPFESVYNNIKDTFSTFGMKRIAQNATDAFITPFKNIQWPKLKAPHFNFSWDSKGWGADVFKSAFGWGGTPKLSVDWYAKGGVFDSPSVIGVGEGADSEAVLPLNNQVFSQIAKGISNNGTDSDEDSIYRAFVRALQEVPISVTTNTYLDSKRISTTVRKEIADHDRRYSPIKQF